MRFLEYPRQFLEERSTVLQDLEDLYESLQADITDYIDSYRDAHRQTPWRNHYHYMDDYRDAIRTFNEWWRSVFMPPPEHPDFALDGWNFPPPLPPPNEPQCISRNCRISHVVFTQTISPLKFFFPWSTRRSEFGRFDSYTMDRYFNLDPGFLSNLRCPGICGGGGCARWIGEFHAERGQVLYGLWIILPGGEGQTEYWLASEGLVQSPKPFQIYYNSPCDMPVPPGRPVPPPQPPNDEEEEDMGCNCPSIAAMLALQTTVQTGAITAALSAHFAGQTALKKAQTAVILGALTGTRIPVRFPDIILRNFSLFGVQIGIGDLISAITSLINSLYEDFPEGEEEEATDIQKRIYNILGGDAWFSGDGNTPRLTINPEKTIQDLRQSLYPNQFEDSITGNISSLIGLIEAHLAVQYHRAGYYQLPATLLADITGTDDVVVVPDAVELQKWLVLQIDALIGQFPINLDVKGSDGELKRLQIDNLSEAIAEMIGSQIASAQDSDLLLELLIKNLTETIKSGNSANVAAQYGKANSEFLGYQLKQEAQEVPYSVTPGAKSLKEILTPSKKRQVVPVFDDKTDLMSAIGRLAIDLGIVKAAFTRQAADLDSLPLPGEGISEERANRNSQEDTEWAQFIAEVEVPPAQYQVQPGTPKPDIKDLSV